MAFSLDSRGFQIDVSDQVDVHQTESGIMQSSGTSAASSGEPSCHSCIRCRGRMNSFSRDRYTYCCKCRGFDCGMDSKCDECMSWTKEMMEAYVKLRKSSTSKSRHRKSVCSDRILAFGIRSIRSPAKVGLVVTELLITSTVVSWRG